MPRELITFTQENFDRKRWPNISPQEAACSHTNIIRCDPDFLDLLQAMRKGVGAPLPFTSIFRHETHPVEANKVRPGSHNLCCAADIWAYGDLLLKILDWITDDQLYLNPEHKDITGIGVKQFGPTAGRFIHVDGMTEEECESLGITGKGWESRFWSYPQ